MNDRALLHDSLVTRTVLAESPSIRSFRFAHQYLLVLDTSRRNPFELPGIDRHRPVRGRRELFVGIPQPSNSHRTDHRRAVRRCATDNSSCNRSGYRLFAVGVHWIRHRVCYRFSFDDRAFPRPVFDRRRTTLLA